MAEPTNEPTNETPEPEGGSLDQSMIDALMNGGSAEGAGEAEPSSASDPDATSPGTQEISQADIDALMGGSSAAETTGSTGDSPPSPDTQEVSQADIDVLMSGAGANDSAGESPASEPEPDTRLDSLGRPFDAAAAEMQAAIEAEAAEAAAAANPPPAAPPPPAAAIGNPLELVDFEIPAGLNVDPKRVTMLSDVNLPVKIELGRTEMLVEDVLQLGEGSIVELDKLAGDPVDVYINSRLVARGEVLVLNDNFCVRIGEVISNDPHRVSA